MSVSKATTLYLVRHGATDANLRRPYVLQGRGMDLPLNETGRRQAQCVRKLFERTAIAAVYSSPLRRAFETAQAIAEPHRLDVADGRCSDRVRRGAVGGDGLGPDSPRLSAGIRGLSARSVPISLPRRGIVSRRFAAGSSRVGGASASGTRADRSSRSLHNVVIRACAATFLGIPLARAKDVNQNNGGVNVLRRENGRTDLMTLNSVFHIEDDLRS